MFIMAVLGNLTYALGVLLMVRKHSQVMLNSEPYCYDP